MTVKIMRGNLLDSEASIILHQVNLQGVMGGGIAAQIADRFPDVEDEYLAFKSKRLGEVCFAKIGPKKWVGNCFSQRINFDTDYEAIRKCWTKVKKFMRDNHIRDVAIPYNYGCGIANGDWDKVFKIYLEIFDEKDLTLFIYRRY